VRREGEIRGGVRAAFVALGGLAASLGIFIGVVGATVLAAGKAIAEPVRVFSSVAGGGAVGPRLVQEDIRIPSRNGRYEIAVTVLRPEGAGPFGAVILNHGVPGSEQERAAESAVADFNASAPVFARRGYVVVMPMRRGFGATGGEFAEDAGPCRKPDYMRAEAEAAEDVMAAYDHARTLPYVDGSRMILAGQSAGGIVSLFAAGTRQPQGLVAVLAFAAGRGGNPDIRPGVPCAVEAVAKVFDTIGKTVKVPALMHYAENDKYFNPATTRLWHERFTAAGAQAEFVMQPAFGKDGHYVFGELLGVRYWLPAVESFLARHGVPFERLDTPSQPLLKARLPNVPTDSCKSLFRAFLESPAPRAYAVSGDGRCGFAGAMPDAPNVALGECRRVTGSACALYAVDSEVVWKEPAADTKQASAKPAKNSSTGSANR
jgi:dienelactone hydrolase